MERPFRHGSGLTSINLRRTAACTNASMSSHDRVSSPVPNERRIAERLLAHARLCRQIAEAAVSHEVAQAFGRLADECVRAAAEVDPDGAASRMT